MRLRSMKKSPRKQKINASAIPMYTSDVCFFKKYEKIIAITNGKALKIIKTSVYLKNNLLIPKILSNSAK